MSEFAYQLAALGVPGSTLQLVGLIAWIVDFVTFWVMAVLWIVLPFKLTPQSKRERLLVLPFLLFLPESSFTPGGRAVRKWLFATLAVFIAAWAVAMTMGIAMQTSAGPG